MDNYFILSSKFGDEWTKVTSDMTSVKLGTCIHIMGKLSSGGDFSHKYLVNEGFFSQIPYERGKGDHQADHHFPQRVHSDFPPHLVIQSMIP